MIEDIIFFLIMMIEDIILPLFKTFHDFIPIGSHQPKM